MASSSPARYTVDEALASPGTRSEKGETMIAEHDRVVLTADRADGTFEAGDVGTVVHVHDGGKAFEVEFVALDGETVGVATLLASQVRPVGRREITHARTLAGA